MYNGFFFVLGKLFSEVLSVQVDAKEHRTCTLPPFSGFSPLLSLRF